MTYSATKVNSPCIGECALNIKKICVGCFRSSEEITLWLQVDNKTRLQYLDNCQKRKSLVKQN